MSMDVQNANRTRRIAKNTLMLYGRMLVLMLVGLYTSRVVLAVLGENDFGIYNVVGGVVAMFTIISGALNSAVQRFITFEMGRENGDLNKVYSTAVTIQLILALVVAALAEPAGLWFIENEMTIDPARIPAAKWVLHFSLLAFVINLMSVPQMASITAHEKMSAYAWIGLLDGFLRLSVAFLIMKSPIDRLVYYAALMAGVVLIVRLVYGIYCRKNFEECRYRPVFDRKLIKEMFSFAGWNFIGVSSGVLRDHGGNILVNLFSSGTAVNAARGAAFQLNNAIQGFVTNFMTAVNPQITKSYAAGDTGYLFPLLRRASRMSFFLLFVIALPVLFNTGYLLGLWLKDVPQHTALFVQLFLVFALSESISNPLITAMLATGKIRNYQLAVGGLQLMNVPVSYICLRMGAIPEVTVVVAIVISQICFFVRLLMLRGMIGIDVWTYMKDVYFRVLAVAAVALAVPLLVCGQIPDGFMGFCLSVLVCVACACISVLFVGCDGAERREMIKFIRRRGA